MTDSFSGTELWGSSRKSGGDALQMQGVGSYMGDMTDNSNEGWGADGNQEAGAAQAATGGNATDNVDIGSINISSQRENIMSDSFDYTGAGGYMGKQGGDALQMQGVGSYMGDMTDNSNEGWGADGEQGANAAQSATGGNATDNVDIGSINISSQQGKIMSDSFDYTGLGGGMSKRGGDALQEQGVGSYMGAQTDNSTEGWGTAGAQEDLAAQMATGGNATDNVDIGSINISSQQGKIMSDSFDYTGAEGYMGKRGGDALQAQGVGSYMGAQTDNSTEGWGTMGEQGANAAQMATGGNATDNVDIGSINISSQREKIMNDSFDYTGAEGYMGKRGGDALQAQGVGSYMGAQTDNSTEGWGTMGEQGANAAQIATGGNATDNVDIGSINISSQAATGL